MTERRPIYPIHPGEILADELTELQISAADNSMFRQIASIS